MRPQLFAPSTHTANAADRVNILNKFAHKMKTTEVTAPTRDSKDYILHKVEKFEEAQRKANRTSSRLPGAYEPWQRAVCGGHRISAGILNYLLALHEPRSKYDPDPEFRFTADDIIVQVFKGMEGTRKTIGKALARMVGYGLISVTRDGARKLKGRYPDMAARIHLKIPVIEQKKRDFFEGKLTKKTGEKATPTWGNVTPSQTDGKQGVETHAQQVQTEKSTGDFPWGSVTPPSVSASVSSLPTLIPESEKPTTEDSPSKATRAPIQKFPKKNSRWNVWVNPSHGDPVPEGDDTILAFSRNHWCMALVHLFQVPDVPHEQAREFMRAIASGEIGVWEMLFLQLVIYPRLRRKRSEVGVTLVELHKLAARLTALDADDNPVEKPGLVKYLLNNDILVGTTQEAIDQGTARVVMEMNVARVTPLEPEKMEDVMSWACNWSAYVSSEDSPDRMRLHAAFEGFLSIRPEYPQVPAAHGQEDQPEDPAEPATAPASAPDCNPCSEIPDWAYDPQFRPYWQGDLPPRAETTTQDDDDDDDFPAWVLDHHAFNTAKN